MTNEIVNHFKSLPDDLNMSNELLKLRDEESLSIDSNSEDKLNKRSSSQKVNQKAKFLKINVADLQLELPKFKELNKKLDLDTDFTLCSTTQEFKQQKDTNNRIDIFNQELLNKAQEINEKNQLKFKLDETHTYSTDMSHLSGNNNKPTKSYRSLSIISKRASNRMLKFHRTSISALQQHNNHNQLDDSKEKNDSNDFSKSIRFDMPSLTEINEITNNTINNLNINDTLNETHDQTLQENNSNIIMNSNNNNLISIPSSTSDMNTNKSSSSNILTSLEYLMNNSKFNTSFAIANIAAAASAAENNLITNNDTETVLQNFFMDLVIPNVDQTNNLNINTNDNELSLIYQQHLMDNTNNYLNSNANGDLNSTNGLPESSSTFNLANMNANKQTNDQIMRTCMGYLDYINKKHNKERRTQIIRNKISGFVLLTLVFLMVFGLAMIMVFCLTNALAKILLTHSISKTQFKQLSTNSENKTGLLLSGSITNYSMNKLKIEDNDFAVNSFKLEPVVKKEIRLFINNLLEILVKTGLNLTQPNLTLIETNLFNLTAFTLLKYLELDNNAPSEIRYYRFIDEIN